MTDRLEIMSALIARVEALVRCDHLRTDMLMDKRCATVLVCRACGAQRQAAGADPFGWRRPDALLDAANVFEQLYATSNADKPRATPPPRAPSSPPRGATSRAHLRVVPDAPPDDDDKDPS